MPLARVAGRVTSYYCDEIDATFTVVARGDGQQLRRDADTEPALLLATPDGAFRARGMSIRFESGEGGRTVALIVDAGRVRDIRFARAGGPAPVR